MVAYGLAVIHVSLGGSRRVEWFLDISVDLLRGRTFEVVGRLALWSFVMLLIVIDYVFAITVSEHQAGRGIAGPVRKGLRGNIRD